MWHKICSTEIDDCNSTTQAMEIKDQAGVVQGCLVQTIIIIMLKHLSMQSCSNSMIYIPNTYLSFIEGNCKLVSMNTKEFHEKQIEEYQPNGQPVKFTTTIPGYL